MKTLITLLAAAVLSASAQAENIAITGARIFTQTKQGVVESGTLLMRDGKIEKIAGQGASVPDGYTRIDAKGKVVTPGLVGALTSLGLVEVDSWAGEVDASAKHTPSTTTGAALDVSYAINPDSTLIDVSRIEGVTSAATTIRSTDMLFNGQGAVISLGDDARLLSSKSFMVLNVDGYAADDNGGSRAAMWVTLEQIFAEVDGVDSLPGPTGHWEGINARADITALKRVASGKTPLFMEADRASDIRQIIAFKSRHKGIKVVLLKGAEAWRVAGELAKAEIPVILDPEANLPGNFEQLGATLANASRLEKAGVMVAIGMETHNIRLATQHAGNAVANGLSYEGGIASLTSAPAKILGVSDKVGSLAPGMRADVVIWSGDPLEVMEVAEQVYIGGEAIDMSSRQTKLRDRYLKLMNEEKGTRSHYLHPDSAN